MKKIIKVMLLSALAVTVIGCSPLTDVGNNNPYKATYTFTESVVELNDGKGGSLGVDGKYVLFGDFPQTLAESDVKFNEDPEKNGYYVGSDGNYYEKVTVTKAPEGSYKFKDGITEIVTGQIKYFKVEPIKWRVLTEDFNGTKNALLFAEDILNSNVPYYEYQGKHRNESYANNYKDSQIRAYLNGISYNAYDVKNENKWLNKGFLQKAFSSNAQNKIAETTVKNDGESTTDAEKILYWANGKEPNGIEDSDFDDFTCEDTKDKIFLLSEQEVTAIEYGFAKQDVTGDNTKRIRIPTDYARANYSSMDKNDHYVGVWWLRSPLYSDSDAARVIITSGYVNGSNKVNDLYVSIVPALCIKLQ